MNKWSLVGLYANEKNRPYLYYFDCHNKQDAEKTYSDVKDDGREWVYLEIYYGSRDKKIPELNLMKLLF